MGICQCLEISNSDIYASEKDLFENKGIEDLPENTKLVKINRNNKLYSNFTNYNKIIKKTKTQNEFSKSEILFEDISFISKALETSIIDYYQISKNIFDILNSIRMNPDRCLKSLNTLIHEIIPNDLINGIEIEKELKNNYASVNSNHNNYNSNNYTTNGNRTNDTVGSYLREKETLKSLIEVRDFFSEFLENNENTEKDTDLIIWSEKVYLTAYEYLVDVEEKLIYAEKESASNRVSAKMKNNYNCLEFNVNGVQSAEVIVLYLLIENKERLRNILIDNYDFGAVCNFPTRNSAKARTLFYLVKKNTRSQKVYGVNPFSGKQQDLSIFEPIFQNINYKSDIIDGNYESYDEKLKITFNMTDGGKREEVFYLS